MMLSAISRGKRRGSTLVGVDLIFGSEDLLTASVFERILYLSDDRVREIFGSFPGVSTLVPQGLGEVQRVEFWPSMRDCSGRRVEPDLLIVFDNVSFLVEAKRFDGIQQQSLAQLDTQLEAAINDEEVGSGPVIQLAVGGNAATEALYSTDSSASLARVFVDWADLYFAVVSITNPMSHELRVVGDVERAFALHGFSFKSRISDLLGFSIQYTIVDRMESVADTSVSRSQIRQISYFEINEIWIDRV